MADIFGENIFGIWLDSGIWPLGPRIFFQSEYTTNMKFGTIYNKYILSLWFTMQFCVACRIPPWHFWKFFLTRNIVILHVLLLCIFIFGWFYYVILNECILEFENFNFPVRHDISTFKWCKCKQLFVWNNLTKNIPSSRDSSYFRPEMHLLCDNFFSLLN